ncbi:MAG: stalk domain-containing protein [Janthinobacterium lividum]
MKTSIKGSFRGLTGAAAVLAVSLGLNMVGPHRAYAAPHQLAAAGANDLGVTILSPDPHVPLAGLKPVEISAFYQGSPANQIIAIELFIDGAKAATKTLDAPETRGVVSFLVDAGQIPAGTHQIVIRATAADQEVQSAKSVFTFNGMDANVVPLSRPSFLAPTDPTLSSGLPPTLRLISPSRDGRVQGTITLHVEASDPSGKAPYVSLFIDKTFKTLRNYAPYDFDWDTTGYSNGYHTIEAYGYNDSTSIGHAKTLRLYVNNPGGETQIRHDLLDGVKTVKAARLAPAPKKQLARVLSQRRSMPTVGDAMPQMPEAQMASLVPSHPHSTAEIVRQLASGAGSLRFGSLGFATELSTPFAAPKAETAAPKPQKVAVKTARVRSVKPAVIAAAASRPLSTDLAGDNLTEMAETPARAGVSDAITHLQKIASVRLPESDLASPFVVMPHVKALSRAAANIAVRPVQKTPLKIHTMHVHLPASMNALLRAAGQKTLLFDSTTVAMDRPLTAQNRVLFGPLRQIFEQGGGTLTWQSYNGTVHAKSATKDIMLTLGDNHARVNAKQVTLDGRPYLLLGRTMVPVSFIGVALDANVQFDPATGHLLVTSRK